MLTRVWWPKTAASQLSGWSKHQIHQRIFTAGAQDGLFWFWVDRQAPFLDECDVEWFWWVQIWPRMRLIRWTARFCVLLCSPTLRWVILQLFKQSLPVPVGQITRCQVRKKRHYERGSIANYSSALLRPEDWAGHCESLYPARRWRLDFVFLRCHDGQQYWMSFISYQRDRLGR